MRNTVVLFIALLISCSYSKLSRDTRFNNTYKILKIDSTKSMYLIQFQNGALKELILSEKNCKKKLHNKNKILVGKKYDLKFTALDSYFNDDDFEKMEFKVDSVDVKSYTEGSIYFSNNLCGLYIYEKE
ncbi:hypothetical protein A1704_00040 [Chryseobacterium cucumeris]|uniref:hypothetical protein n=1 Tax=Chryseobacterium cucumeris TaxID=1813611 RepID=UPI00078921D4|nr:hypothetical protein [Chryseobacterium cucumeris]KYH07106.1 hypothetical protein A1704_00040 [Chryseobacterium cucumeris]